MVSEAMIKFKSPALHRSNTPGSFQFNSKQSTCSYGANPSPPPQKKKIYIYICVHLCNVQHKLNESTFLGVVITLLCSDCLQDSSPPGERN